MKCANCGKKIGLFKKPHGKVFCSFECEDASRKEALVVCPNCGKSIDRSSIYGKVFCSSECEDASRKAALVVCPNCSSKIDRSSTYCSQCGYEQGKDQTLLTQGLKYVASAWASPDTMMSIERDRVNIREGNVLFQGKWVSEEDKERLEKGLAKFYGHWGTKEQIEIWKQIGDMWNSAFESISPFDFEQFVAKLFEKRGFTVSGTKQSGDFGVDVIAKAADSSIGIQVKKYAFKNNVGVTDINQVLGGAQYYKLEKALIVTTSDFSRQAQEHAAISGVELWNLERLEKEVSDAYLDGMPPRVFFREYWEAHGTSAQHAENQPNQQNPKFEAAAFTTIETESHEPDFTFFGHGDKRIPAFYCEGNWHIKIWYRFSQSDYNKYQAFMLYIKDLKNDLVEYFHFPQLEIEAFRETFWYNSSGKYYLDISCSGDWRVQMYRM